ncbi:Hsp60 family chaperonin [Methylocella silvestris]|uniref:Molecular chaperone GroEL n=1 Tax=Methylocella silvestris TaxID=199596 RepID=A0A2J7TD60_METSI|nr:molecular chaperone GroEL [Methylocella silvestris]PNG24689.1 molecular chaperone GroEL [Methylocella silvestris]
MAKDIRYGDTVRRKMLAGANLLADAVQVTLGPRGRNVVIQHRTAGILPVITKDGVTVARSIAVDDRFESAGINMFKEMAGRVSKECGDGTTTTIVLARFIARKVLRAMSSGLDPNGLRTGLELATQTAVEDLKRRAKSCADERSIVHIAATASNGDLSVGEMLAAAFKKVGPNGIVNVSLGNGTSDEITFQEGAHWEQGWLSPYFMTDKTRRIAELTNPYVLLYDRPIKQFDALIPILDQVRQAEGSLLIIADDVEEAALGGILLNHIRCVLKAVAVKPPAYGDRRKETLADLACLLGGRAILEGNGDELSHVKLADLGRASRAEITESETTLFGGAGDADKIAERVHALLFETERLQKNDRGSPTGKLHDLEEFDERIGNLSSVTATIHVGGDTETEMKERLQRVENARNAVAAALAEGGLPGGGAGLLRCRKALSGLSSTDIAVRHGIQIIADAVGEPLRRIADNSGKDALAVAYETLASSDEAFGFDVRAGRLGDLFEAGVIDPLRVTRLALQYAAITASTLMTTECVVANLPPDDPTFGYTGEWAAATREDPRL